MQVQNNNSVQDQEGNSSKPPVSGSLPSKDEAVNVGFRKATVEGYNYRRVCREPDHDIYYSGWMDCYDWLSGNDR